MAMTRSALLGDFLFGTRVDEVGWQRRAGRPPATARADAALLEMRQEESTRTRQRAGR